MALVGRVLDDYTLTVVAGRTIMLYNDAERLIYYTIKPIKRMVYMLNGEDLRITKIDHYLDEYYAKITAQNDIYKTKITITELPMRASGSEEGVMSTVSLYKRRWFRKNKLIHTGQYNVSFRNY
jgi:hypothetical protein